jgi:membrane protease YdiL (CAAX protease family)
MSAKSLDSKHRKSSRQRWDGLKARVSGKRPEQGWRWSMLALLPLWVFAVFMFSSYAVAGVFAVLDWLNLSPENILRPAILQTILAVIVYALTIGIVIGAPYLWKRYTVSLQTLGLTKLPSWTDIGLAPLTYVVYVIVLATVLAMVANWLPSISLDQAQDVGFQTFGSRTDNILAFLTLVVLAPIAEEVLFRGYLYGKLRRYVPVLVAALMTSLLFALVHFQLNVGIDVFILSMFLCGLRSLTGSIWAGVLVHMIKNGVAYYLLFVAPLIGG